MIIYGRNGRQIGKSIVPTIMNHLQQKKKIKKNTQIDMWFNELLNDDSSKSFNEIMQWSIDMIAKATGIPNGLLLGEELKGFETEESRYLKRQRLLTWLCARNEFKERAKREKINFYRLCRANHLTYPG
jgi:hypothetical protein